MAAGGGGEFGGGTMGDGDEEGDTRKNDDMI